MKIIVFLSSKEYVRNYVTTDAFSELRQHQVTYLLTEAVTSTDGDRSNLFGLRAIEYKAGSGERLRRFLFTFVNRLQMYAYRNVNRNFIFRLRRELIQNIYTMFVVPQRLYISPENKLLNLVPPGSLKKKVWGPFLALLKLCSNILAELPGLLTYAIVSTTVVAKLRPAALFACWEFAPLDQGMKSILCTENPDLILIPSSIVESKTYELIRASIRLGIGKTLLLVDNWDNLSSKSTFIQRPNLLGVMGRQSAVFAEKIHGFQPKDIRILGTPRFEVYKEALKESETKRHEVGATDVDYPYILFAGCAAGFDEIGALRKLDAAFGHIVNEFPKLTKIVYRPHPWGARDRYLRILESAPLSHVEIDPQILCNRSTQGADFQPSLDYYPQLLGRALIVVCPLSTMLLEATLMRKQVLALAHEDQVSLFSPNRMLKNYRHFEGLDRLDNVVVVEDLSMLQHFLLQALRRGDVPHSVAGLDYFLDAGEPEYKYRLAQYVNEIGVHA